MNENSAQLSVENLSKRFGGLHALNHVNMTFKANQITALIGPNGAGKTTLFNCLTGFYKTTHGDIIYRNGKQNVSLQVLLGHKVAWGKWHYLLFGGSHLITKLGIVRTFQHARLFRNMTVMENMLVASNLYASHAIIGGLLNLKSYRTHEQALIKQALHWLQFFELDTDANRLAGELACGQQRMLEIARCMCTRPKILCLDEPAAGLNPKESKQLSQKIVELKKQYKLTVILIEHDMSVVMNISDHIYVLDQGELIASGNAEAIKTNQRVIDAYLGFPDESA